MHAIPRWLVRPERPKSCAVRQAARLPLPPCHLCRRGCDYVSISSAERCGAAGPAAAVRGVLGHCAALPPGGAACFCRSPSPTNCSVLSWVDSSTTGGATPASIASRQRAAHRHQPSPAFRPGKLRPRGGGDRNMQAGSAAAAAAAGMRRLPGHAAAAVPCPALRHRRAPRRLPAPFNPEHRAARPQRAHRYSGRGVMRSLPCLSVYSRNSWVTFAHTVWVPTSMGPVSHRPSLRRQPRGQGAMQVGGRVARQWVLLAGVGARRAAAARPGSMQGGLAAGGAQGAGGMACGAGDSEHGASSEPRHARPNRPPSSASLRSRRPCLPRMARTGRSRSWGSCCTAAAQSRTHSWGPRGPAGCRCRWRQTRRPLRRRRRTRLPRPPPQPGAATAAPGVAPRQAASPAWGSPCGCGVCHVRKGRIGKGETFAPKEAWPPLPPLPVAPPAMTSRCIDRLFLPCDAPGGPSGARSVGGEGGGRRDGLRAALDGLQGACRDRGHARELGSGAGRLGLRNQRDRWRVMQGARLSDCS